MLKQNTTILAQMPLRHIGGLFAGERTMWDQSERRNKFISEAGWDPTCGQPNGHLAPSSWNLPQKSGGMSSYTNVTGAGVMAPNMALGLSAQAALSGSGGVTATAQLVISMIASLSGSGGIVNADFKAYLNAVANLSGSGGVVAAMGAMAWAQAAVTGGGNISNATPYAKGTLSATIRGYSDLTPEGIRDQVWTALADGFTAPGTMGNKLNSAASGGVDYAALGAAVWSLLSVNANAPGSFGEIMNLLNTRIDMKTSDVPTAAADSVWAKTLP